MLQDEIIKKELKKKKQANLSELCKVELNFQIHNPLNY